MKGSLKYKAETRLKLPKDTKGIAHFVNMFTQHKLGALTQVIVIHESTNSRTKCYLNRLK